MKFVAPAGDRAGGGSGTGEAVKKRDRFLIRRSGRAAPLAAVG